MPYLAATSAATITALTLNNVAKVGYYASVRMRNRGIWQCVCVCVCVDCYVTAAQ